MDKSICLYFQMHQPYRLRRFSVFENSENFYDDTLNLRILNRVTTQCYRPIMQLFKEIHTATEGQFKLSLSISGLLLQQLKDEHPDVIATMKELVEIGCVEMLGETYYHSLASVYSTAEFKEQVHLHDALVYELLGAHPKVFRNTELIYDNQLPTFIKEMNGYIGLLTEGDDKTLDGRSPNQLYHCAGNPEMKLLLKHYRLSDDIAFRFSDRTWSEWPLTAEKYVDWIAKPEPSGPLCNLFMDIETFGEHQHMDSGIFEFLKAFPPEAIAQGHQFVTASEAITENEADDVYDVPEAISWADTERDLSAWTGNAMQSSAIQELYDLEQDVKDAGEIELLDHWRKMGTSDHFYYMSTKYFEDGRVHQYFSHYESPYDSYINYMNVLDLMKSRVQPNEESA